MATAIGPQHPFWRDGTDDVPQPQQAGADLIGRLLAGAPEVETVVIPSVVEHGDPVVRFIRLADKRAQPHRLVSLPVDHRKSSRVIRLHEPHLGRTLSEKDKFSHWRRWMVASKFETAKKGLV